MLESVFWVVSLQRMKVFSDFLLAVLAAFFFKFAACGKQKYTAYYRFHENGPYGKIPTKKEPIRTRVFTSRLPCHIIIPNISVRQNLPSSRGRKSFFAPDEGKFCLPEMLIG